MHVYGSQLAPLLEALVAAGGVDGLSESGSFHRRALWRASLRRWLEHGAEPFPEAEGGRSGG
jgi:hypothetical protein